MSKIQGIAKRPGAAPYEGPQQSGADRNDQGDVMGGADNAES